MRNFFLILAAVTIFRLATPRTIETSGYALSEQWWLIPVAGLICLLIAGLNSNMDEPTGAQRPSLMLRMAGLLICSLVLPSPWKVLGIVGLCLVLAALVAPRRFSLGSVDSTLVTLGIVAVFGCLYAKSALYLDSLLPVSAPLAMILGLAGFNTSYEGSYSYLQSAEEVIPIAGGAVTVFPPAVCLALCALISTRKWLDYKRAILACLLFVGLAFIRSALVLTLTFHYQDFGIRTSELIELASLVIFLPAFLVASRDSVAPKPESGNPKWAFATLAVGAALICFSSVSHLQGERKGGRVVIQEGNSTWEPFDSPVNDQLFGVRTMYNYTNLGQDLMRSYKLVINRGLITDKILSQADVLILKCPTSPYLSSEATAIDKFIQEGGGVWLISDHTDVFGMSVYLNELTSRWGFTFGPEAVITQSGSRQLYGSSPLVEHPTTLGLVEPYLFYTGCSIYAAPWVGSTLIGNDMLMDKPDYSRNTFFGDFQPSLGEYYGPVTQTMAMEYGRGRIAAWADSTVFSGFSVFMPGQAELAHQSINWLNHKAPGAFWSWGIGLGLLLIAISYKKVARTDGALVGAAMYGSVGFLLAAAYNVFIAYDAPKLEPTAKDLVYIGRRDSGSLPLVEPTDDPTPFTYTNSFVSSQRVGFRPQVQPALQEGSNPAAVVLNGLDASLLRPEELQALFSYAEKGGNLVLLDFDVAWNPQFEKLSGIKLGKSESGVVYPRTGQQVLYQGTYRPVQSGFDHTLLTSKSGPVFVSKKFGKGLLSVSTTASAFTDSSLGQSTMVPNQPQITLLRSLWDAFNRNVASQRESATPSD